MTTVRIELPDELAELAARAGLLSAQALETMLRDQLHRRAGEELRAMWKKSSNETLTAEIEQEIAEAVRGVRTARRSGDAL